MISNVESVYSSEYLPGGPYTEKTYSTQISVNKERNTIAYCTGSVVIVRKQGNAYKDNILIYSGHKFKTTSCEISPNGCFVASGDESGCLKIWFIDDGWNKFSHQAFENKILGIHWNEKGDRIMIYGFGKKVFARYISWDTSNTMGDMTGMTKNVISGDLKKEKPFYYVVASEDLSFRMYSGMNPKSLYINRSHSNFISNIKFSPTGSKFALVTLDKKVFLYETETGNVIKSYEKDNELQHKGGVICLVWLTEDVFATGSLDKTVKVWNIQSDSNKTLYPIPEKDGLSGKDIYVQCGINYTHDYLISLNLDGSLNLWSLDEFNKTKSIDSINELPERVYHGHQSKIDNVIYNLSKELVLSTDNEGKIILWDKNKNSQVLRISANSIKSIKFDESERFVYLINVEGLFIKYDLDTQSEVERYFEKEVPIGISIASQSQSVICYENKLVLIENGNLIKEVKLKFIANSFDSNHTTKEIYVGDSMKGDIHFFNFELEYLTHVNFHFSYGVSSISTSHKQNLVVSSDYNKHIFCWNAVDKSIVSDKLHFHTSRVYGLAWSYDDSMLVSTSLDNIAIVWDMNTFSRINTFPVLDQKLALTCCFYGNERKIIVGGHNNSPKIIGIDQKVTAPKLN